MKKLILTIALFSICVLSNAGPGLGIKGGANFANQSAKIFDVDISTSGITGFVGGVYAHWFFGDVP